MAKSILRRSLSGGFRLLVKGYGLNRKVPLSLGLIITHRCNLHCRYCDFPAIPETEMSTADWKKAITEFLAAGVLRIGFSGGEPLLRQDLGELLSLAAARTFTTLNSNGLLLPERIEEIRPADLVVLSVDGPPHINDAQRGPGSFQAVVKSLDVLKKFEIPATLLAVLTTESIQEAGYILELARAYRVRAAFQVVTPCDVSSPEAVRLQPSRDQLLAFIEQLRNTKGASLACSSSYLNLLSQFPDFSAIARKCRMGKFAAFIMPDGRMSACHVLAQSYPWPSGREMGFVKAFNALPAIACSGCAIYPYTETSLLFNLAPQVIGRQIRQILSY